MKKLYALQELRAVASLFIVLFHVTLLAGEYLDYHYLGGLFLFGYGGVDIFFVLSGFVIYYVHHAEIGKSEKGIPYLTKKVVRIYPAYWIVLTALLIAYLLVPSFGLPQMRNLFNIIRSYLLIPLKDMEYSALSGAWALSFEMMFYLMFSLLIFLKKKAGLIILGSWAAISSLNFILNITGLFSGHYIINFLFSPYNIEFLLGIAAAYAAVNWRANRILSLSAFFGGAGLFILGIILDNSNVIGTHRFLIYGLPAVLLIYGMASYEIDYELKSLRLLVYLGNASFSTYLVHFAVLSLLNKIFLRLNLYHYTGYFAGTTVMVVLSVAAGCAFYELIERRLNKWTRSFGIRDLRTRKLAMMKAER